MPKIAAVVGFLLSFACLALGEVSQAQMMTALTIERKAGPTLSTIVVQPSGEVAIELRIVDKIRSVRKGVASADQMRQLGRFVSSWSKFPGFRHATEDAGIMTVRYGERIVRFEEDSKNRECELLVRVFLEIERSLPYEPGT